MWSAMLHCACHRPYTDSSVCFTVTELVQIPCFVCILVGARPYYVRPQPFRIITEPTDEAVRVELLMQNTTMMRCEVDIQPIVSGWWPHIYWRHNSSTVNSSWPIGAIDTNFWNFSVLHTTFPGSYQCVVDDGNFILVSRMAQITLLCKCMGSLLMHIC